MSSLMATIEKRTAESGTITYRAKIRIKGAPVETASFARITDAKRWVQQTEAAIREGRHFKTSESKRRTLGEMIDRYITHTLPLKPKSERDQKRQLLWWKKELGAYALADVTAPKITEARDKLLATSVGKSGKSRSTATVVRYMAALSHAFTIAVNEWGWLDDSPMRKVSKPKEARGRVRYLSDDERAILLSACQKHSNTAIYPVVVLALATGMRQGEVLNLRWGDVDIARGRIILHETKNGERRSVPLVGFARQVVQKLSKVRRIDTDLLFPATRPTRINDKVTYAPIFIRKAWQEVVTDAGLENFRFHDLRHSAASYLAMNGASLAEIAEVLGHKTLQMVKRYAHLSEAHTSKVVAAMNERIFG
jgi:integrase